MSTQIQRRRGTTAQHASFTGVVGETTIDTDKDTVVVHDGTTVGGHPLMRENGSNSALALGSAGSPSLKWDANTGLYSPGADQVAISTNGTGRLFVNADGTIDFGTTTGSSTPTVKAVANPVLSFSNGTNSAYVGLVGVNNRLLNFSTNGTTLIQSDSAINLNVVGGSTFTVGTNNTERLRITSAGLVGVGTSAPQQALSISGAVQRNAVTLGTSGSPSEETGYIYKYEGASGTQAGIYFLNSHNSNNATWLSLKTTSSANVTSTALTIDSSQRVGIGTSAPDSRLHVRGGTSGTNILVDSATSTDYTFFNAKNSSGVDVQLAANGADSARLVVVSNHPLDFFTNNTRRIRIDASGNVGIGTTSPGALLSLDSATVSDFRQSVAGTLQANIYSSSSDVNVFAIQANPLRFGTSNTERARIDSSGRLLVGTTTTSANTRMVLLGNSGGAGGAANLHFSYDGATPVDGQGLGYLIFGDNTQSNGAWINAARDGGTWSGSSKPSRLVFSTTADGASSPTERMRIDSRGLIYGYSTDAGYIQGLSNGAGTVYRFFAGRHSATGANGSGTESYRVWSNGNVENTNNSYGAISDIKLKENIVDANSQWDDIKALQVRNYNFKEGQTHTQIGLIAQEVELVSPGLVSESPDRDEDGNDLGTVTKSVNYSVLYMKAVKALQEAMERIEQLEAEMAEVKAQLS